jgi:hypothetical protein
VHQPFTDFKRAHDSIMSVFLCNNLDEFLIPLKEIRLKYCLNETYSRVRVGKRLSDMLLIMNGFKQGDDLSPLLFNFSLE